MKYCTVYALKRNCACTIQSTFKKIYFAYNHNVTKE